MANVEVTYDRNNQVKDWVKEHKKELIAIGVGIVGISLLRRSGKQRFELDPRLEDAEKFVNALNKAGKGATRWDALSGDDGRFPLYKLGNVAEFLMAGDPQLFKPDTEVTGVMVFTNVKK